MLTPALTPETRDAPLCAACVQPMSTVRIVEPIPGRGLRLFRCEGCGVVMFTEL